MTSDADSGRGLDETGRERLDALRATGSLADLCTVTGEADEHDAYFAAKREWRRLRGAELEAEPTLAGLPGNSVVVDGTEFRVHGVTHAGTDEEDEFLREHVAGFLDAGAAVYCEQGIRPMYFSTFDAVRAMDDYQWATERSRALDEHSRADDFDGVVEDVTTFASVFRDAAFSLVDAAGDRYGDDVEAALGDVASAFFTSHADAATGEDFESFTLSRAAAADPSLLDALQRYYERAFLPQPVEREWLRRHDHELELVTHARNARMADYAVYDCEDSEVHPVYDCEDSGVHLVVGAAHQPGVTYYLAAHRDGQRSLADFEPVA